jgi:hypothetical protein
MSAVPTARRQRAQVLADTVTLTDGAAIDASGATGGGEILIGGDYQGMNPEVLNAWSTTLAAGASVRADAFDNGDGGRIIVWADDTTRFAGAVSARGGSNGGDGGFIEVSGKRILDFRGTADTSAPQGRTGMLLLDPTNIFIADTDDSTWITQVGQTIANHNTVLDDPRSPRSSRSSRSVRWWRRLGRRTSP